MLNVKQTRQTHLRDYQLDAIRCVHDGIKRGKRNGYISCPTGTGKSRVLAQLANDLFYGTPYVQSGRVVVISHRQEIVSQLANEIDNIIPNVTGIVQGDINEIHKPIIVGTIQSLRGKRLDDLLDVSDISITALLIDEVHHVTAQSYRTIINRLYTANPNLIIIGATATPFRSDKNIIQEIIPYCYFERSISDMQQIDVLAPFIYQRVEVPITLTDIIFSKLSGESDYNAEMLAQAVNKPIVNSALVQATIQVIGQRKTLVFCSGVKHAEQLAILYNNYGISATSLSGNTPQNERIKILDRWRNGNIQIVTNDSVLTEGFDYADISCIVLARPTASYVRYMQQIGRGSRIAPNKENCLIVEATSGIPDKRQITLNQVMPIDETNDIDIDIPNIKRMRKRDSTSYLAMMNPKSSHIWRWRFIEKHNAFTIPLNKNASLWVIRNPDSNGNGLYKIGINDRLTNRVVRIPEMKDEYSQHTAIELASKYLSVHATRKLAKREQYWHELPASEKQINFLRRYANDVLIDVLSDMAYGDDLQMGYISEIIDGVIANWTLPKVTKELWK